MGVGVIALKAARRDLGAHLAAGLGGTNALLGAQLHPPAVLVQSSGDYLVAQDYCSDLITFDVTVAAPPGDLPAVADALDDMIDQVRATCATLSPLNLKYRFVSVGGYTTIASGDTELPAVVATIGLERNF